jgi:hypothetical protein
MSKLVKRKSISGAPTPGTPTQEQSVSEVIKVSFDAWIQNNFPECDGEDNAALLAAYMGGAYTGAKLITDSGIAFVKGAFEAHGTAINTAKAPPITT